MGGSCCLTGETKEDTLINHVKWLSSWAITMTKKVDALHDLIDAMIAINSEEARRAIADASTRMISSYVDRDECTKDDPYGLKLLINQFERAGAMVSHRENIPDNPKKAPSPTKKEEPPTAILEGSPTGIVEMVRFFSVGGEPTPDIQFQGHGSSEAVVRVTDIIRKCLLIDQVKTIDDIQAALDNDESILPCVVSYGAETSDGKCNLMVRFTSEKVERPKEKTNE